MFFGKTPMTATDYLLALATLGETTTTTTTKKKEIIVSLLSRHQR
jgi:hypothetical protein